MDTSNETAASAGPYVGPRPFETSDQKLFFGRRRETSDVTALVASHGEVVLYAQSGAGKTSLLNAALIPAFEKRGFAIRGPARVAAPLPGGVDPAQVRNPYVFNVLRCFEPNRDPSTLTAETLATFLGLPAGESDADPEDRPGPPTSGTPPDTEERAPILLIFDQLEELFEHYPDRWKDRADFFDQIGDCLERSRNVRVLFILREEYIAQLDRHAQLLPERLATRYRLERLRREAALTCVIEPLARAPEPRRHFAPGVAETLVDNLLEIRATDPLGKPTRATGEFVEPVQLQVVCQTLFRRLPPNVVEITRKDLQDFGDASQALSGFYEEGIRAVLASRTAIERGVNESQLRRWFGTVLLTSGGTRGTVHRGDLMSGGLPTDVVELLEDARLVRQEHRAGAAWYELTHDRLIEPILESNRRWRATLGSAEETLERLKERAAAWIRAGQPKDQLLRGFELLEAERLLASPATAELEPSSELRFMVNASRNEVLRRRMRRLITRTILPLAAVALIALASAAMAVAKWFESRSRELAALSVNSLETDPQRSLLLAIRAFQTTKTWQAEEALRRGVLTSRLSRILGGPHGHTDKVWGVAFDPRGRYLATASSDTTVKLWPLSGPTTTAPTSLSGHTKAVIDVDFAPGGDRLVSASEDGTARIWNVDKGQAVLVLTGHAGPVIDAVFSGDGTRVATAGFDGTARLWDAGSGREVRVFSKHQQAVVGVSLDQTASRLATASLDGSAIVWNTTSGAAIDEVPSRTNRRRVNSVALSPDGNLIAFGADDGRARVREVGGSSWGSLIGHRNMLGGVAFSPGLTRLATASFDGTAKVWSLDSGRRQTGPPRRGVTAADEPGPRERHRLEMTLAGHGGAVYGIAFSADGRWLATGSHDRTARIWDISGDTDLRGHHDEVRAITVDATGLRAVTASADRTVKIWDLKSRQVSATLSEHTQRVTAAVFDRAGSRLVSASADGSALVRGLSPGASLTWLRADSPVESVLYLDDNTIVTAHADGLTTWNLAKSPPSSTKTSGVPTPIRSLSATDRYLAVAGGSSRITLWDVAAVRAGTAKEFIREILGQLALFSPDGRLLAVVDGVKLNAFETEAVMTKPGTKPRLQVIHGGLIDALTFSTDGKHLATAGADHMVRVWDAGTGELLHAIPDERGRLTALAFDPQGTFLAVAGGDWGVRLHPLAISEVRRRASERVKRRLTAEECHQYAPSRWIPPLLVNPFVGEATCEY